MADWQAVKTEYITTDTSYRKLAEKYDINYKVIADRGKKEGWGDLRSQHKDKVLTRTLDKIGTQSVNKLSRIDKLTDALLDKIERAIDELDLQLNRHVTKTKTIEYNHDLRPDKPTKEIIHEEEILVETQTIVDRQGLKQIASALKDIKEVKMLRSDLDLEEQRARIDNLRRQAASDSDSTVEIVIGEGLEEYTV